MSRFRGGDGIDPTYTVEVRAGDAQRALDILQEATTRKHSV